MLGDLFLKVGEREVAKKQKSPSTFSISFHLFDVSMKTFFFEREKKKKVITPAVKIKNEQTRK